MVGVYGPGARGVVSRFLPRTRRSRREGEFAAELFGPRRTPARMGARAPRARDPGRSRTRRPRSSASRPGGRAWARTRTTRTSPRRSGWRVRSPRPRAATSARRWSRACGPTGGSIAASSASGSRASRFPRGPRSANPEKPDHELARVSSAVISPRFGAIGLGLAFRDVAGGREPGGSRAPGTAGGRRSAALRVSDPGRFDAPWEIHAALAGAQVGFALFPILGKLVLVVDSAPAVRGLPGRGRGGAARGVPARAEESRGRSGAADCPRLVLYGLLGVSFNQILFILGLSLHDGDQHDGPDGDDPGLHAGRGRAPRARAPDASRAAAGIALAGAGALAAPQRAAVRLEQRVLPRRRAADRQLHLLLALPRALAAASWRTTTS